MLAKVALSIVVQYKHLAEGLFFRPLRSRVGECDVKGVLLQSYGCGELYCSVCKYESGGRRQKSGLSRKFDGRPESVCARRLRDLRRDEGQEVFSELDYV